MKRNIILLTLLLLISITSLLNVAALAPWSMVFTQTTSSSWTGTGGGTITVISVKPRMVSVTFDKEWIEVGAWVTVTLTVTNDGPDTAPFQTVHIGLPFDPPAGDIQIVSTDASEGAKIYPKGSTLGGPYGSITSKYPIVEALQKNFAKGVTRYLTIKVKFPDTSTVSFDVKTVACTADWKVIGRDPSSGIIDQQGEYIRPYLILSKFSVTLGSTDTKDVPIEIKYHNRYPPAGAPSQPNMVVTSFTVTDKGGFLGSITAINIPLAITHGGTATLIVRIATSDHPSGTYTIKYRISGTP